MRTTRALLVDAFTDEPLTGNPAGLVPDADGLTGSQMGAIAREFGASATAFLMASDAADRRVRFFTPTAEIDLRGHATVASHACLADEGIIDEGNHTLETDVGVLGIVVDADGTVWMTQHPPEVREVDLDPDRVGGALGIGPAALAVEDLPMARATTGLPFLVVPVRLLEHLGAAAPDMAAVEAVSEEVDVAGVYAFTFDTLSADSTLHGRAFAPAVGIPEDPVTGTASGAAGAYLRHVGAFDAMPEELTFEQGHFVDRPGSVRVRVDDVVQVGGRAVVALEGELRVPDRPADDIVEA